MRIRARERTRVVRTLAGIRIGIWQTKARVLAHRAREALLLRAGVPAWLVSVALLARAETTWRRLRRARPRLIWGPSAIINIKYWSAAMRARGYESRTCIDTPATISKRGDFDAYRDQFLGGGPYSERLRSFAMFAWTLRHGDVFIQYFDGGFLRGTEYDWWECGLLRLAGKRLVASPYGGDIAVPGYLGHVEDQVFEDYPHLRDYAPTIRRRVLHTLRWADVSIRNYQAGFQPSYNVVWPTQLGIDTDLWSDAPEYSAADGTTEAVVVIHAPNHRAIKGTAHLERAVRELRAEGLKVDLQILEGRPNDEILAAIRACDIVADQFLDPGYGLFSIESMAAGKPVLCRMSPIADELRTESLTECPIVDTDPENLGENIRRLAEDPALRVELGQASRDFAIRYHSLDALGRDWQAVVEHAWRGAPLPERLAPPQPAPSTS